MVQYEIIKKYVEEYDYVMQGTSNGEVWYWGIDKYVDCLGTMVGHYSIGY